MAVNKGRGSAAAVVAIAVVVGLLALAPGAYAVTYEVGGTTQKWNYAPSNSYTYDATWAPLQTFYVGDALQFQYSAVSHDVVQYANKTEYDACRGAVLQKWQSGNDVIPLNSTGFKYFICSFLGHCTQGMKVSVNVVAPAPPPVAPPPPPPATPDSAASSGPVLSIAGILAAAFIASFACLV